MKSLIKWSFVIFVVLPMVYLFFVGLTSKNTTPSKITKEEYKKIVTRPAKVIKEKVKKPKKPQYKVSKLDAQITCNSVIPLKFSRLLKRYEYKKLILLDLGDKYRWSWSLKNTGKFIKCLVDKKSGRYEISLESY